MTRLVAILVALATGAALATFPPAAPAALEFERTAVALGGEAHRLLTGHLVHYSARHFAMTLGTLALLAVALERRRPGVALRTLLGSTLALGPLLLLDTRTELYGGLSGQASALFAALIVTLLRAGCAGLGQKRIVTLAGAGFLAKLIYETFAGVPLFMEQGLLVPYPAAHLVGALAGAVLALPGPARPVPAAVFAADADWKSP
jgi:rhomboid family GlyGly-CTERM serine protease